MKSVLVIGMGRFGRHLASKMQELGNDVMVIDKNEELIEQYSDVFTDAQVGDCTNKEVIRALGVEDFDICFVTIGDDFQSSLVITSLLKEFGAERIISKAKQDIQADLLKKIGADEIVYPEKELAERLAIRYSATNLFDYIQLTGDYSIYEIPILHQWIGKSIVDIDVRNKYRINIIAVKNEDGIQPMPGANYSFKPDDHIIVIGKSSDVFKISDRI